MKNIYNIILLLLTAGILYSCDDEMKEGTLSDDSSMFVTISAPQFSGTRSSDGITMPADTKSQLSDGWAFNSLAVFVTYNSNGQETVAAYRNFELDTQTGPAATSVTLDLANGVTTGKWISASNGNVNVTLAKSYGFNKLVIGDYKIYAVANYNTNSDISNIIKAANNSLDEANLGAQLKSLKQKSVRTSGSDGMCDAGKPMILSLVDNEYIQPGQNVLISSFKRTYTRIKVTMRNESLNYTMRINNLDLGKISQTTIPLFESQGALNNANATPVITSAVAKKPFTQGLLLEENTPNKQNEVVVFDGYVLENAMSKGYKFNIDLSAEPLGEKSYYNDQDYSYMTDGGWFVIYCNDNNKVLYNNNGTIEWRPMPNKAELNGPDNKNYFWVFESNDTSGKGALKSVGANNYVQQASNNSTIVFGNRYNYFSTSDYRIRCKVKRSTYELDSNLKWVKYGWSSYGDNFTFKHITFGYPNSAGAKTKHATIDFTKLVNKKPVKVTEIRRNEFYHIFINTRHNDKTGTFEFKVDPWNEGGGSITFD